MFRTSLPAFALLVVFVAVQAPAPTPSPLRVAIVESQDEFTGVKGLSEYFASREIEFDDWSDEFEAGEIPSMEGVDLVVIGSFVSADREKQATYEKAGAALQEVVERGGVVAVMCQADQHSRSETWMPEPRVLRRADPDAPVAHALQSEHPLWNGAATLADEERRGWKVPTDWRSYNTIWEGFNEWNEGGVVIAADEKPGRLAGVVEMGWGKGRALFYAIPADKALLAGNAPARSGGDKLLANLVAYAELVKKGEAPELVVTPPPGFNHPILGTVYRDENHNGVRDNGEPGIEGMAVSDGLDIARTDSEGKYKLENAGHDAAFVYLHQQDGAKYHGQEFFHLMPESGGPEVRFDFGVKPVRVAEEEKERPVRFVQLTDSHIRNPDDRQYMIDATNEIYELEPAPDFVVATGDLVDWGVDEHYQNYVAGMQKPPVPYFNVFGNHEIYMGPVERYHKYIGPDYYSFEMKGVLYLALNCVTNTRRQDTWLDRTLEQIGKGRPVVVFQHFPPTVGQTERFARLGVKSVFSGHWHSEKEMEHAGVQNINSPTFVMGGIDASPAGFKIVELHSDGSAKTAWRYGFQDKRLTIVSPQGNHVDGSYFPVVVNAYDTKRDVESVEWHLGSKEKPAAGGKLKRESATSWTGHHGHSHAHGHSHDHDHDHPHAHEHSHAPKVAAGSYPVEVTARDSSGRTWTKREQVELISGPPVTPAPQQEWHMFMGNASHTGDAGKDAQLQLPLRLVWSTDTGGDPDFASPIYADGRIYLGLKKRTQGRTHGVAAFDPVGGERLWCTEMEMAINHTPAYHEGILCVAEMGGRIYGLDAKTGDKRWHHDLMDNRGRFCYCAPAVHEGSFYAGVMRRTARLRATDGQVVWEKTLGSDTDWISTYSSPAVSGDTLVMGGNFSRGASLAAVDTASGEERWGHGTSGRMLSSPTIAGKLALYVTVRSELFCCGLEDGKEKWKISLGEDWSATTPAVRLTGEGQGIVVAGSGDGQMHGIDLASGEIKWTHTSEESIFKLSPYRRDGRPLVSSATIAGERVFFGSADGHLYCLDLATGKVLWKYVVGLPVMSTPLVTGNALYVAAYDGRLYCFTGME